ncbi:PAS domain-containing protein [Wocania ichthyoenteri]|uniref:PAS domain-containing protein n=1 Tax=Wocania ichthyoenteri TaxID=1230531 RepID=UPI0006923CCB|nr:PAS domain-containing protein [Wocania ichthyoenteri]
MKTKERFLRGPLLCWDIYAMYLTEQTTNFNRETELDTLKAFKEKFNWSLNIEKLFTDKDFEALILTDNNQHIQWVNKGFTKMTGYPANYAKGKKPNFLQGEGSSEQTKRSIRKNLNNGKQFKEQIINYKKDGTPYNCEIEIFPIKDNNDKTIHHLAIEKEIGM